MEPRMTDPSHSWEWIKNHPTFTLPSTNLPWDRSIIEWTWHRPQTHECITVMFIGNRFEFFFLKCLKAYLLWKRLSKETLKTPTLQAPLWLTLCLRMQARTALTWHFDLRHGEVFPLKSSLRMERRQSATGPLQQGKCAARTSQWAILTSLSASSVTRSWYPHMGYAKM